MKLTLVCCLALAAMAAVPAQAQKKAKKAKKQAAATVVPAQQIPAAVDGLHRNGHRAGAHRHRPHFAAARAGDGRNRLRPAQSPLRCAAPASFVFFLHYISPGVH